MADSSAGQKVKNDDITIINQQGKVMVNRLGSDIDEHAIGNKAAQIGTHLLNEVKNVIEDSKLGELETILIQGANGKFCVLPSSDGQFFVTLLGNIL
ncbi:hypothetical protein JXJ21_20070 [candidate division KSB1 bacterium]|nr:hypothetical protein [candidate division KSB1 bacterium]